MADYRAQRPDHISPSPYPHPPSNQFQCQNPRVAGNYQEGIHRDGVPQPAVVRGEMQYPPHVGGPNYNPRYYHALPPPVLPGPHVHMYQDARVAELVRSQAHPFTQEPPAQENNNGYGTYIPIAEPPVAFSSVQPHPAPLADISPAANGLRNLVGHFLNNPEEPDDDRSAVIDATPPPLGVKLTGYRLVFMATILVFGTVKTILTYMGQSIAPTTFDWVSGTVLTAMLYWIGLYEESNKWKAFFQVDYAPAFVYFGKCVAGTVLLLPELPDVLVFYWMFYLLSSLFIYLHILFFDTTPAGGTLAVSFVIALSLEFLCLRLRLFSTHGQRARHVERYRWFGLVGRMVGHLWLQALLMCPGPVFLSLTFQAVVSHRAKNADLMK